MLWLQVDCYTTVLLGELTTPRSPGGYFLAFLVLANSYVELFCSSINEVMANELALSLRFNLNAYLIRK